MNAHKTPRSVRTMALVVILIGLMAGPGAYAADPNGNDALWDSSALFAVSWESVTRSLTAYNPVERSDQEAEKIKTVLVVSGQVYILDANDLIAITMTNTAALQAFDQDGNEVRFDPNTPAASPSRIWMLGDQAQAFSVELHLDPNQPYVTSLSELSFTVDALYGQPFATIDLPFETTEDWVELVPRYRIRVEEANSVDGRCRLVIQEEMTDIYSRAGRSFTPDEGLWDEMICPRCPVHKFSEYDVIVDAELVDAEGNPVRGGGSRSVSSRASDGVVTGTREYSLRDCPDTEHLRIRYTIALDVYEMPIPLTLTEIPVPGL